MKYIEQIENLKKLEGFWNDILFNECRRNLFEPNWGNGLKSNKYVCEYKVDKDVSAIINNISKVNNLLIYIVMLTALRIQINNYINEDIILNIPGYKERNSEEDVINKWLPLKSSIDKSKKISDLIKECRIEIMTAYQNQNYPLENILKKHSNEDLNNILGQVYFGMSNIHGYEDLKDIKNNKIYIYIEKNNDEIYVKLSFNPNHYDMEVMKNFIKNYEVTLRSMLEDIKLEVSKVSSVSEEEIDLIMNDFNNTTTNYPKNSSVKELFEDIVRLYPNNIAVVTPDCRITYEELDRRATRVCRLLKNRSIKTGDIVPIISGKDIDTLIGILGIVKSGAAYMPIDIEYPEERINYMLKESKSKFILGISRYLEDINVDVDKVDIQNIDDSNLEYKDNNEAISPEDLIYIMYTSGSTGEPKGVCIRNKSVVRLVRDTNLVDFDIGDKILQTGSMGFDAATFDIWGALLNGLELHIQPKKNILDAQVLKEYMWQNKITTAFFTSALFYQLCNEDMDIFKYMKHVIVGGDVVSPIAVSKLLERNKTIKVYNGYGPTENTTFSTVFKISDEWDRDRSLPIGKPLSNSTCYVMNSDNKLLPIGIIGELYIGGDGIAKGYLNKIEMTKDKFIENPYIKGSMLYKTGDLARWLPDGNIEYFGRVDKQVKINGFRIEIDEIEKAILGCDNIREAVIIDKKGKDNNKKLYAYVVSDIKIDENKLKNKLMDKLPKYMIPFKIHQVDYIPLNVNGKVDKKKLLEEKIQDNREIVKPRTHIEKILCEIWSEVLGESSISIKDNFLSVGGDSIKAINVVSKLRKELEIEVGISDIFSENSLEDIAKILENREHKNYSEIKLVEKAEYYESSSAQKRMYLINQMDKNSTNYNMPYIMEAKSHIDKSKLQNCINEIVARHESLRTTFHVVDNKIVQKVHDDLKINIDLIELDFSLNDNNKVEEFLKSLVKPFDLENAPLMRCSIIKLRDIDLFFIDTHHIIVDGESFMIFLRELNTLYRGEKVTYEPVQYKDYAFEENNKSIEKQKKYWIEKFDRPITALDLPLDYKRPKKQSFKGNHISKGISPILRDKINKFMMDKGVSKNMIYLSALGILFSQYSREEEIIMGIPCIGRTSVELQNTIGMFVNTLPIIINSDSNKNFETLVDEVKNEIIKVTENQDYQLDKLIEDLDIVRNEGRNPLFDIMFSFNNFKKNSDENNEFITHEVNNEISKFDITIIVSDNGEDDNLTIEYATDLFKEKTICRIIDQYLFILEELINNSHKYLKDLSLINSYEKNKVLFEFNDTKKEYESNKSIGEIFREVAIKYSENIALVATNRKVTYKELNRLSNNIAGFLKAKGVGKNDVIAIVCEKNIQTIVNILGIVRSGASYLPIDESYPEERKKYMIHDSKAKFVIASEKEIGRLKESNCEFIDINILENNCDEFQDIEDINDSMDIANIIYTSGSTGNPKGVCVRHKNIIRLVNNNKCFQFKNTDRMLQTGSIAFDASTWEIWGTLLNGATLYIEDNNIVLDSTKILESLEKNEITIMFLTAALFNQMGSIDFSRLTKLRCLLTGGDIVSPKSVSDILKNNNRLEIIDAYGPTENGVVSTSYKIKEYWDPERVVPIGKPISNSTCYVLDGNNKLLPIGALGELCVGGDGVSKGYLYREELTKEKFINNPYVDNEIIYKTGDLVRWLEDGSLEFNGRIDKQVKINGFRIEIEEIERTLLKDERIENVAVIHKEISGNKKLIAFIVTKEEIDVKEVKNNLKDVLPKYMIPASIVRIENIPLTQNGKVDNKYLSNIDVVEESNYETARNIVELKIYNIWKSVLGVNSIDINDNFFDIGGNSILTVKVSNMIKKELGVNVPISEIYARSTIKDLAQYIDENSNVYDNENEEFDENIILLKRGRKEGKNLFFIPDGTGDPSSFINIVNGLSDEYTCWGIKSNKFDSYAPKEIEIEKEAMEFKDKIQKIQKEGPYNLVAFCYGAYISTEIIKEIEKSNDYLNELLFIDSIPIKLNEDKLNDLYADWSKYSVYEEIKFINEELSSLNYDENSENVEKLWDSVIELNKDVTKNTLDDVKKNINQRFVISRNDIDTINLKRLVKHINTIRSNENATSLYKKKYEAKQLKSRLTFIKASKNELFENEFKNWKEIYSDYSNFIEVEGDHFSIMKGEAANKISNIINNLFK